MARYRGKSKLAPFAELVAQAERLLSEMTVKERRDLIAACRAVTDTKCWWAAFHAAKLLESDTFADSVRRQMRKPPQIRTTWRGAR